MIDYEVIQLASRFSEHFRHMMDELTDEQLRQLAMESGFSEDVFLVRFTVSSVQERVVPCLDLSVGDFQLVQSAQLAEAA